MEVTKAAEKLEKEDTFDDPCDNKIHNPNRSQSCPQSFIIDDIVSEYGYSLEVWKIITTSYFILFIDGYNSTYFSSMIIPYKELFQLDDNQISLLGSLFYISKGLGFLSVGFITKYIDRIYITKTLLFFLIILGFFREYSTDLKLLIFNRSITGIFVGMVEILATNVLCEFLPKKFRAFTMIITWGGYAIGQFTPNLIMFFTMPKMEIQGLSKTHMVNSIICFGLYVVVFFMFKDSPRNLILNGYENEAIEILSKMKKDINDKNRVIINNNKNFNNNKSNNLNNYRNNNLNENINKNSIENNQPDNNMRFIKNDDKNISVDNSSFENKNKNNNSNLYAIDEELQQKIIYQVKESNNNNASSGSLLEIFSKEYRVFTFCALIIFFNSNFYGDGFTLISTFILNETLQQEDTTSRNLVLKEALFLQWFNLMGNLLCAFLVEIKFLGRRRTLLIMMTSIIIIFILSIIYIEHIAFFMSIFNLINLIGDIMIVYTSEVYPTRIRDLSTGFINSIALSGSVISQYAFIYFLKISFLTPFYVIIGLLIISIAAVLMIPVESHEKPLDMVIVKVADNAKLKEQESDNFEGGEDEKNLLS